LPVRINFPVVIDFDCYAPFPYRLSSKHMDEY